MGLNFCGFVAENLLIFYFILFASLKKSDWKKSVWLQLGLVVDQDRAGS